MNCKNPMTSQLKSKFPKNFDEAYMEYHNLKSNLFFEFYFMNQGVLTDHAYNESKNFLNFGKTACIDNFENIFCLDGSSDRVLGILFKEFSQNKEKLQIPKISEGSCFFVNYAEGFCSNEVYNLIHFLIDVCNLQNYVEYRNCSVNNQNLYDKFCITSNLPKKISKCSYANISFLESKSQHYKLPNESNVKRLTTDEKKLFNCFNWNPWEHRLALIGLLNYNDLLNDGYVTSPGVEKFSYNPDKDFDLLKNTCYSFFVNEKIRDGILTSLENNLKNNYPLKIDDRSKYFDTDVACYDEITKIPMYEARINSFIEVVTETKFTGEHFFSEKTFWPVICKKPFIMAGSPHSLKSFRQLGFRTFDPFIDESYDDIEDPVDRLIKIVDELKKLKILYKNDFFSFKKQLNALDAVVNHNYNLFYEYQNS